LRAIKGNLQQQLDAGAQTQQGVKDVGGGKLTAGVLCHTFCTGVAERKRGV
jgi:hypothetical protein